MRLRIVDAFTDRAFGGNPAGVVMVDGDRWPAAEWMHAVACELDLPMTAFVCAAAGGDGEIGLRWFRTSGEERLCGHATLATGHVLHGDAGAPIAVRFATIAGTLPVRSDATGLVTLDFPAAPPHPTAAPPGLAEALGAIPRDTLATGALRDLLAVFGDEETVRMLRPDPGALAQLTRREGLRGVIATAPADNPAGGYAFVSRFFSPADGLDEDPVTGSAHTALAPYWSRRLGRTELQGLQASARQGLVATAWRGDRVELSGRAVTVLDGGLRV